jgi:hypothetical protein
VLRGAWAAALALTAASAPAGVGAASPRPGPVLAVLVDVAPSVSASDPGGRLRLAWVRLLSRAAPRGWRVAVGVFAAAGDRRWLGPGAGPGGGPASLARLPRLGWAGPTDAASAAAWALAQLDGAGRGGVRAVVVADDEPDPGERAFPPAYARRLAEVDAAYAARGDGLVTVRVGDNPGPERWPVVGASPMAPAAARLLRWLGWTPLRAAPGLAPTAPAPGLFALAPESGGTVVLVPAEGPGPTLWAAPGAPPVVVWRRLGGRLALVAYAPTASRAVVEADGRRRTLRLSPGVVRVVAAPAGAAVGLARGEVGAVREAPGGSPPSPPAAAPGPRNAGARPAGGEAAARLASALRLGAAAAAGALFALFAVALAQRRRRRTGAVALAVRPAGGGEGERERLVALPPARGAAVLGAAGGPGVTVAVPTAEEGALARLERVGAGWRAQALGHHHLYGADGLPRRSLDLPEGVWVRVADVALCLRAGTGRRGAGGGADRAQEGA